MQLRETWMIPPRVLGVSVAQLGNEIGSSDSLSSALTTSASFLFINIFGTTWRNSHDTLQAGMHQRHLHTKQMQDAATSKAVQAGSLPDLLTKCNLPEISKCQSIWLLSPGTSRVCACLQNTCVVKTLTLNTSIRKERQRQPQNWSARSYLIMQSEKIWPFFHHIAWATVSSIGSQVSWERAH